MPPMPIKLSFLSKSYDEFFSTNPKIEAQRCSWKIIQLHTRESFGKHLAQHCPWGHLTKWNDLEELTPNIHELRVCAALSKIRQACVKSSF